MKIVTWNVNGLRACERNGFSQWVSAFKPDVLCLQEVKAEPHQLERGLSHPADYQAYWHPATCKKGYSGVGLWSAPVPQSVQLGIGVPEYDAEGRIIVADFAEFVLFNVYFPNGSRDHGRVPFKLGFYEKLLALFDQMHAEGRQLIVTGDFNTAHGELDLANPRSNQKTTGFLPEERVWVDRYLAHGFVDVFRRRNPEKKGAYTWWSYRPGVREKNIGWRIDYFLLSEALASRVKDVYPLPDVTGSDHCPVVLEI